jgi:hypothetical protein
MKLIFLVLIPFLYLEASVILRVPFSVQRLDNGNTLIVDGGGQVNQFVSKIIEVEERGSLVWAYIKGDLGNTHHAEKLTNDNILMADTRNHRVIETDLDGNIIWSYSLGEGSPNDANRLSNNNTLITDRNNSRVIEVTPAGTIVWSYTLLNHPHNADRLANGNTIVCNSTDNEVIEVDSLGNIVWSYATGLNWPRDADRLTNGNTLITDTHNHRVIEITPSGTVVWSYELLDSPYEADRLDNGNTLISNISPGGSRVIEVDSLGAIVWQYPETTPVVVDTVWVYNPASGCTLYTHIHRPIDASPANRFPGVIMIPDYSDTGTIYDSTGLADRIADDGFILVHFDPDGRGQSTNHGAITTEDYCGYNQQDGLWEIAKYLWGYSYVDSLNIGIFSEGYGGTMASGELSRHMNDPYIKFLLDWEGPSDRYQTSQDSGGHVPVPVDSESFWIEREAGRFMKSVNVYYLRMQTEVDHNSHITDNRHAIALIDSGTAVQYGGKGICPWTRVNDSLMNPANMVYTVASPPEWILESHELFNGVRNLLYLHELSSKPLVYIEEEHDDSRIAQSMFIPSIVKRGEAELEISINKSRWVSVKVYDISGRLVQDVFQGMLTKGRHYLPLRALPGGVYFVVVRNNSVSSTKKVIFLN